jgi:hypothetical protein
MSVYHFSTRFAVDIDMDSTVTICPCGECFSLSAFFQNRPYWSAHRWTPTRGSNLAWRASSIKKEDIGTDATAIKDNSIVDIHQRATRDSVSMFR